VATTSKPARIAVVGLSHPHRGGIAHYSTLLVRELRRSHEVCFVTLRRQYPGWLFPGKTQYDRSEVPLVESNHPWIDSLNPLTWLATAFRLRRGNFDLVLIQWWHPFFGPCFGTIAHLLMLTSRTRVAFLCHNVTPHDRTRIDRLLTKFAFWRVRHFIVHSEADERELRALEPKAQVQRSMHPPYEFFADHGGCEMATARRRLGLDVDVKVLLFFGYVRPYKGLIHLVRALPAIVDRCDCILLIVGEFYDPKQPYLDLITELGIQDRVRIVDRYVANEEVTSYFGAANVVVLPYESASQSGVAQVAFGLGVPVITTDVGGLAEAVEHGRTGLIVPSRAPAALAEAVVRYCQEGLETHFRDQIRSQARTSGWQSMASVVEALIEDARSPPAGGGP
jgi:glycosyltransferase involved in cell wall biosynthesis